MPVEHVVRLPDGISFDVGASLGVPAMTAHRALTVSDQGPSRLAPGTLADKVVLVAGGAGAVGHAAIQLARWAGATVVTTVSSEAKATLARAAGAHHVVNYRESDAAEAILAAVPDGVDIVVEVAPGPNAALDLAVTKNHGTIAVYANNGGDSVEPRRPAVLRPQPAVPGPAALHRRRGRPAGRGRGHHRGAEGRRARRRRGRRSAAAPVPARADRRRARRRRERRRRQGAHRRRVDRATDADLFEALRQAQGALVASASVTSTASGASVSVQVTSPMIRPTARRSASIGPQPVERRRRAGERGPRHLGLHRHLGRGLGAAERDQGGGHVVEQGRVAGPSSPRPARPSTARPRGGSNPPATTTTPPRCRTA